MRRRDLLRYSGLAVVGLAGCVSEGDGVVGGGGDDGTTERQEPTSTPTDTPTSEEVTQGEPPSDDGESTKTAEYEKTPSKVGTGTARETEPGGEATVVGKEVRESDGSCASGDDDGATISFEGQEVVIDGRFVTPDPCHVARIETANYDGETDTLQVTLSAERTEGVCVQCVGVVEYVAAVEFEDRLPGRVVVSHRTKEGEEVVAREKR